MRPSWPPVGRRAQTTDRRRLGRRGGARGRKLTWTSALRIGAVPSARMQICSVPGPAAACANPGGRLDRHGDGAREFQRELGRLGVNRAAVEAVEAIPLRRLRDPERADERRAGAAPRAHPTPLGARGYSPDARYADTGSCPRLIEIGSGVDYVKRLLIHQTDRRLHLALTSTTGARVRCKRIPALRPRRRPSSRCTFGLLTEPRGGVLAAILRRVGAPGPFFGEVGVEWGREGNSVCLPDVASWQLSPSACRSGPPLLRSRQ